MNIKIILSVTLLLSLQGCSSMVWHKGSVIQYKNIEELDGNRYSMDVLGGWRHNQEILEDAVLKKAKSLCPGNAEIVSSSMSTYNSSTYVDGVSFSGNPPKITSIVQCTSVSS